MSALKILTPIGPTVRILDSNPLLAAWRDIFERTERIPIKLRVPYEYRVNDRTTVEAYLLDVTRLTPIEHSRLVSYYWHRFDISPDEARQIIADQGVPLRADGVVLEIQADG